MRLLKPQKPQSAASYIIEQKRAARDAGQDRPKTRDLLQQYKSMNAAPVRDIASTTQSPNNPGPMRTPTGIRGTLNNDAFGPPTLGPGAPLPSNTPNPAIISQPPMGADYNAGADIMGGGMKKGGSVSSASKRADGIATKGKTRGKYI